MNRNRGIWIVIGSILIVGILVTFATVNFVKGKDSITNSSVFSAYSEEDSLENQKNAVKNDAVPEISPDIKVPEEAQEKEAPPHETMAPAGIANNKAVSEKMIQQEEEKEPELKSSVLSQPVAEDSVIVEERVNTAAESEPVITPITPDSKARAAQAAVPEEGVDFYQKQLEELDSQIKKMREESEDSNTYSMKALADKELKLWNREQNMVYDAISQNLPDEEKEELEASQQEWTKNRDSKAEEAAKKYSGGSLEELEYTASLAESTRERAYDLIEEYKAVLTPQQ